MPITNLNETSRMMEKINATVPKTAIKWLILIIIILLLVIVSMSLWYFFLAEKNNNTNITNATNTALTNISVASLENRGVVYVSTAGQLKFSDFKNNELMDLDAADRATVSLDGKSLFEVKINEDKISLYQDLLDGQVANLIYNSRTLFSKVLKAEIQEVSPNLLVILVTREGKKPAPEGTIGEQVIQDIYTYDINQKEENVWLEEVGDTKDQYSLLAGYGDYLYLLHNDFESLDTLFSYRKSNSKLENISEKMAFSVSWAKVSPNRKYIAMTIATREGNDIRNTLSFFDLNSQTLLRSKLTTLATDDYGVGSYVYGSWSADSSFIYVEDSNNRGGNFFPLKAATEKIESKQYFVTPDGTALEQKELNDITNEFHLIQPLNNLVALAARKTLGPNLYSYNDMHMSAVLLDLNTYQSIQTIIPTIIPSQEIIGFVK